MKRLARSFGVVLSAAGVAFLAWTIASQWSEVERSLSRSELSWLLPAFIVGACGMTVIALVWGIVLRLLGADVGPWRATTLYYRGEVAKYVPGGVWSVVGRGELARREGVAASTAYASVLLSLVALYVSCAAVAAALVPFGGRGALGPLIAVIVVVVGVLALHPRVLEVAQRWGRRVTKRELGVRVPSWGASVSLLVCYVPAWLAIGTATWAVVRALGLDVSWAPVVRATATSWLIGFLAVPVPGGIGVREAVFVATLPETNAGAAAAAALVARLVFMLIDGAGGLLSWLVRRERMERVP